ncbi:hypothetical protein ACFL0V_01450 [Nanoarchaeota archaeon]
MQIEQDILLAAPAAPHQTRLSDLADLRYKAWQNQHVLTTVKGFDAHLRSVLQSNELSFANVAIMDLSASYDHESAAYLLQASCNGRGRDQKTVTIVGIYAQESTAQQEHVVSHRLPKTKTFARVDGLDYTCTAKTARHNNPDAEYNSIELFDPIQSTVLLDGPGGLELHTIEP